MAKKKNGKKNNNEEFEDRMPALDRKYEDIPLSKKDPIMKMSQEIQHAHTKGLLGIIFGIILPVIGLLIGISGFLQMKAISGDVPYDLKRRYMESKSLCKAAIAVGILMTGLLVVFLTSGGLSLITRN